ncbi:MAG: hypothetical protein KJZ91_21945 [Myxococcales bacterium]|nr:hypothetical protein [Myxococcales bacterium]
MRPLAAVIAALAAAWPGGARGDDGPVAGPVIVIVRDATVPETVEAELAPRIRAWLEAAPVEVAVVEIAIADGHAIVIVDGRRREIELGPWDGPTSSRRIVSHVVDLAQGAAQLAPLAPLAREPSSATTAPVAAAAAVASTTAAAPRVTVVATSRLGRGLDATDPWTLGLGAELGLARGRWRAAVGLGWSHAATHRPGTPEESRHDAWPVAAIGAVALGPLELGARAVVAPGRLGGAITASPVHAGVAAIVRWRPGLAAAPGLVLDLGVEAWAQRLAVTIAGVPVFTSPRVAPYLGLGLGWGWP